ncbi:MAG: CPBP family intramembrane glutamic endopeptidase [Myxococcota bacterium]
MRAPPRLETPPGGNAWRLAMLGLTVVGWLGSFAALRQWGTWAPFVAVGPGLAAWWLWRDVPARRLLRSTWAGTAAGLLAGVLMVALTHLVFALVAPRVPEVRAATEALFRTFEAGGAFGDFPAGPRVGLVLLVAASEEILFRGVLLGDPRGWRGRGAHPPDGLGWTRIALLAAVYGASTLTLGSWVLPVVALACGMLWGALRVVTGSVVPPIVTHGTWHVGILVLWPLVEAAP